MASFLNTFIVLTHTFTVKYDNVYLIFTMVKAMKGRCSITLNNKAATLYTVIVFLHFQSSLLKSPENLMYPQLQYYAALLLSLPFV